MTGVFGGTFNPIHFGHLLLAENIREEFGLDKILFIPSQIPPHKSLTNVIEAEARLDMVRIATRDNPWFEVSDIEMRRTGPSYTVDTLLALQDVYGPNQLNLIVGADSMVQIPTWRRFEEILKLSAIIVARRPETQEDTLDRAIMRLEKDYGAVIRKSRAVALNYSSTEIRERVRSGLSITYRVPGDVEAIILGNGYYR